MLQEDFLEAIVKGDSQKVVRLLGQINDTGPLKDGRNALHLAAQHGNADIVSVLLLSGLYDCKIQDTIGYTGLQIAAAEGHLEIVKQLIKSGSDVNAADNVHGNTSLHEAAWKGYSRTVAELAKAKANLDAKNWGGFTPLHLSCQNGHNQSCRELLLAGSIPDVQNNYGDTPLHTSARYGHAGVMRILISAQCHVSDQNKNGDTALHIAAAMNRRKLTRILLEANCNKHTVNKQNETAEDIAARKSHSEILEILKKPILSANKSKSPDKTSSSKDKKHENKHSQKKSSNCKKVLQTSVPATVASAIPWSPYGCHNYPDSKEFPELRLDSLPSEPLRKGEQYYLDLAGNIRKGPVGIGYTCYCSPKFQELETRIEKKTKKIKKEILRAENAINKRLDTLEYCLGNQKSSSFSNTDFRDENRLQPFEDRAQSSLSQSQSLESVFDPDYCKNKCVTEKKLVELSEKRRNILYLSTCSGSKFNNHSSISSNPCLFKGNSDMRCSQNKLFPLPYTDDEFSKKLWKTSRIHVASCESTDEDCEKIPDIPCNDSGYSTKLCSNSQGPSPSLSGRLENDGLLSVTPSQDEKHIADVNSFMSSFKSMSIKHASVV